MCILCQLGLILLVWSHIVNQLKEEEGDTEMTREIKERIKVDLELRYLEDDDIGQLLELASL